MASSKYLKLVLTAPEFSILRDAVAEFRERYPESCYRSRAANSLERQLKGALVRFNAKGTMVSREDVRTRAQSG